MANRLDIHKQIRGYYSIVFNAEYDIRPIHTSLYMFLLNQNNRNNWSEWFKCPYDLGMTGACIHSKGTYYKTLNELQSFKLIEYQKGINDFKAPKIKILDISSVSNSVPLSEPLTSPLGGQLSEPLTIPVSEPLSVPLSGNIDKQEDLETGKQETEDIEVLEKPLLNSYQLCVDFWLKEFHPDWSFKAIHGKCMKLIIKQIEKLLKNNGKEITDELILDSFKTICLRLPEWFKDKDLQIIDSKFNEIIEQIKKPKNNAAKNGVDKTIEFRNQFIAGINSEQVDKQ